MIRTGRDATGTSNADLLIDLYRGFHRHRLAVQSNHIGNSGGALVRIEGNDMALPAPHHDDTALFGAHRLACRGVSSSSGSDTEYVQVASFMALPGTVHLSW